MLFGANSSLAPTTFVLGLGLLLATPQVTCQEREPHHPDAVRPLSPPPASQNSSAAPVFAAPTLADSERDCTRQLNLTDVIHKKFVYLFTSNFNQEFASQVPGESSGARVDGGGGQPQALHKCSSQPAAESLTAAAAAVVVANEALAENDDRKSFARPQEAPAATAADTLNQSTLETRTTNQQAPDAEAAPASDQPAAGDASAFVAQPGATRRNYFRVLNRVFSRVELPDGFRRTLANQPASGAGGGSPAAAGVEGLCAMHIGCIDELPNFPALLKIRPNVSATFTVYSRDLPKSGHRIQFEPLMHHQLQDATVNESKLKSEIQKSLQQLQLQKEQPAVAALRPQRAIPPVAQINQLIAQPLNNLRLAGASARDHHHLARHSSPLQTLANSIGHGHRRSGAVNVLALGKPPANQSLLNKRLQQHHHHHQLQASANHLANAARRPQTTATNWLSAAKVSHSLELPFDLAALEQSNFNASLTTRVIIGGYFAKEDEEWIGELVRAWLQLEPCNVIKVSWQDSNRGLYHTAAYNSRIVGRQLSLFLHYLNELFHVDLAKFHLVGHSLGAHIAGFVGSDLGSRVARITGLDPAGPIFVDLPAAHRLDPSDARFVDVLHTNGGTITKGALGLSTPSGHVDFYCNGGSLQPGCYFSSVTRSIMDPVERVACNHRRSYRYFTELIKLAAVATGPSTGGNVSAAAHQLEAAPSPSSSPDAAATSAQSAPRFPEAYLFHAKQEELVRLVQPQLSILADADARAGRKLANLEPAGAAIEQYVAQQLNYAAAAASISAGDEYSNLVAADASPPLKWQIEFHSLKPRFPTNRRGQYFFRTRPEAPFFSSRQFAITIRSDQSIKRKIALLARINNSQVAEIELDELDGSFSFVFAPSDPKLLDMSRISRGELVPELWLMWRLRSFNLLLGQQNELQLSSVELNLLENYPTNSANSYQLVGDSELIDELVNSTASSLFDDQRAPASRSRSELNLDLLGPGQPAPASASPIRVLEYRPSVGGGGGGGGAGGGAQSNSHPASNRNSPDASAPFSLFRNQWHKFEGKPAAAR